jgi:hypothetical protein
LKAGVYGMGFGTGGLRAVLGRRSWEIRLGLAFVVGGFLIAAVWLAGGTAAIFVGITLWLTRLTVVVWTAAGTRFGRVSAGVLAAGPAAIALLFGLTSFVAAGQALGVIPASTTPPSQSASGPGQTAMPSTVPQPTGTPVPTSVAVLTPSPTSATTATVGPASTPVPTPTPTITPTRVPVPISLAFKGPGGESEPVESQPFTLPAGSYEATWTATTKADCGVTLNLFASPDNGFSREIAGALLDRTTSGVADLGDVPAGRYLVWAYNACPWTATIRERTGDFVAGAAIREQWLAWDDSVADAEGILSDQWVDGLPAAGMSLRFAADDALAWIAANRARIRPEQLSAIEHWAQTAMSIRAIGDQMFDAGTGTSDEQLDAIGQVAEMNRLRTALATSFDGIQ